MNISDERIELKETEQDNSVPIGGKNVSVERDTTPGLRKLNTQI